MKIGAIAAMQCEADILLSYMQVNKEEQKYDKKIYIGTAFDLEIVLVVSGVGKVNAACGAQMAIDVYGVDVLLNLGISGGVTDDIKLCEVYQINGAIQYDFDLAAINKTKIGTLDECSDNVLPVTTLPVNLPEVRLCTGDRFTYDDGDYHLIKDELSAQVRDMEGGAVAQVAMHSHLPFYCWKAISDKHGSGASFDEYFAHKLLATERLKQELPVLFAALKTI